MTAKYYGQNAGAGAGGGGGGGPSAEEVRSRWVLRPGAPTEGNFFATWGELYATLTSPGVIVVDDSFGAPVIPAGTYNLEGINLVGSISSDVIRQLEIQEGAIITGLGNISTRIVVTFSGTTPCMTFTGGVQHNLYVDQGAELICSGAGPMIQVSGTGTDLVLVLERGARALTGTYELVQIDAGNQLTVAGFELGALGQDTVRGPIGSVLIRAIVAPSADIQSPQVNFLGTDVPVFIGDLSRIGGVISSSQHGSQPGLATHALATNTDAGFMAASDKAFLESQAYSLQTGENITAGQLVVIINQISQGTVFLADADGAGLLQDVVGYATLDATAPDDTIVQLTPGVVYVPDVYWDSVPADTDVGKRVYLSATAGNSTLTAPSGSGVLVIRVGILVTGGAGFNRVAMNIGEGIIL